MVCRQRRAYVADEVHVVAVDVLDDHDLLLREEVQGQVVDGVSQDALLDQQHVGPALGYLLDEVDDVAPLLLEHLVDLRVVLDHDVRVDVRLRRRQTKLQQSYLGLVDHRWTAGRGGRLVVGEDDALAHLQVVDRPAHLLHDPDVVQIDVFIDLRIADP